MLQIREITLFFTLLMDEWSVGKPAVVQTLVGCLYILLKNKYIQTYVKKCLPPYRFPIFCILVTVKCFILNIETFICDKTNYNIN